MNHYRNNNLLFIITLLIIFSVNTSCFVDIPASIEEKTNNPNIITPPVLNSIVPDSIEKKLKYLEISTPLLKNDSLTVSDVLTSVNHLGFPDLIKFKENWYSVVRVSDGHLPKDFSYILISKSKDLLSWQSEQIFIQDNYDLRDPKLFISDSILYCHFQSTLINPYGVVRNDYISKLEGRTWSMATKINKNSEIKSWFWRISYYSGKYYVAGYHPEGDPLKLYVSDNAVNYKAIYDFDLVSKASEATIRFNGDYAYSIVRINFEDSKLGKSSINNLTSWEFTTLPIKNIGGPNFIVYNNNLIISGREDHKMRIYNYSLISQKLVELFTLPSKNDTGYPGMVLIDNKLFILYYSGPENNIFSLKQAVIDLNVIFPNK
jgi:hypothetical protein